MKDTSPIHILYADDDPDDRMLFAETLSKSSISFLLTTVVDGEKLMKLLETFPALPPPHVIFLDINMPRKDGIQCLAEIRSNHKFNKVAVFMFSTSVHKTDVDLAYFYGANLYIPKSLFFSNRKTIIEDLFSVDYEKYLSDVSKENFLMKE